MSVLRVHVMVRHSQCAGKMVAQQRDPPLHHQGRRMMKSSEQRAADPIAAALHLELHLENLAEP